MTREELQALAKELQNESRDSDGRYYIGLATIMAALVRTYDAGIETSAKQLPAKHHVYSVAIRALKLGGSQ
jgi:hypothetical protein